MRRIVFIFSTLVLASCGGLRGSPKAPAIAPEGGGELMQDFFTICSTAINSTPAAALAISATMNWELKEDDDEVNLPADIGKQYQLLHTELGIGISIFHYDNSNETGTGCTIVDTDAAELIIPQSLEQLKGFEGRWVVQNDTGAGRWVKRSGKSILSVYANQKDEELFSLVNMNTYRLK